MQVEIRCCEEVPGLLLQLLDLSRLHVSLSFVVLESIVMSIRFEPHVVARLPLAGAVKLLL